MLYLLVKIMRLNFLMDKIIHKSEKVLYAILAILIIAFVAYEILDLIYLFYCEVSQASILENKSIALTGVPLFFNIIIALEILETFKGANEDILRKVKIIVLIALTAISRKIITMDNKASGISFTVWNINPNLSTLRGILFTK